MSRISQACKLGAAPWYRAIILLLAFIFIIPATSSSQTDTSSVNRKRLNFLIAGGSAAYAGTMTGLYYLWYKDYAGSSFHFRSDNDQWMGLDKLGHSTTAYWVGKLSFHALKWAGVKDKHAIWYGGSTGLFFLTTVEIFDGFSEGWGASWGDIAANFSGAVLFIGQQLGWNEQRILLKISYHPTEYAQYRPDVLGSNHIERMIKDYNGQTYWLSGNIHAFLREESKFPKWLNVAFGYGAKGLLGGTENLPEYEGQPLPDYRRTAQYYLTLDIDLSRIPVRSKFVKGLFTVIGFLKIPFPTIEYNAEDQFEFHILYF